MKASKSFNFFDPVTQDNHLKYTFDSDGKMLVSTLDRNICDLSQPELNTLVMRGVRDSLHILKCFHFLLDIAPLTFYEGFASD